MRLGGECDEIEIDIVIFGQKHKMIAFFINAWSAIIHTLLRDIGLDAENRLNARFPCFLIKFNGAIHIAMISERNGGHLEACYFPHQIINFNKPIQEGIVGMGMQMHKVFHERK